MKAKKNGVLYLISASFPYGLGDPFLWKEIGFLANAFEKVCVFPLHKEAMVHNRTLPDNVIVEDLEIEEQTTSGKIKNKLISKFSIYFRRDFWSEVFYMLGRSSWKDYLVRYQHIVSYFEGGIRRRQQLLPFVKREEDSPLLLYSYWGSIGALCISLVKKQCPKVKIVTRVHGFDVFEEDYHPYYLPCRQLIFSNIDCVLPISQTASNYLQSKYNLTQDKLFVSRLGVVARKVIPDRNTRSQIINIVSCSSIIPLKRVALIAKSITHFATNNPALNITWTHMGNGLPDLEDELQKLKGSAPTNLNFNLLGKLPIDEVLGFYKNNEVHLFINASTTEGIPMSIMEAFSYGIPAIATDVGATSEIVNEENGMLVSKDASPQQIGDSIENLIKNDSYKDKCDTALKTWQTKYNAEKNFEDLVQFLQVV